MKKIVQFNVYVVIMVHIIWFFFDYTFFQTSPIYKKTRKPKMRNESLDIFWIWLICVEATCTVDKHLYNFTFNIIDTGSQLLWYEYMKFCSSIFHKITIFLVIYKNKYIRNIHQLQLTCIFLLMFLRNLLDICFLF